ncbi:polysaccharide deacetylase family protein [Aureitalea sp. L0-47]|uniref:polysaccharide deacetylase family protein n=1 Tax=Aureitalea sp. L0-47 TaxID=2816962 RepID=UPI002237ACEF|nr:polysaccharide deacetylase family protein [Aureitalea sp. L0-47]MCW5518909.1 polysaccharide deacetylase family protein [Aureitalea sp. L0-47]
MNPFLVKTPSLVKRLNPSWVWSFPQETNAVYLTFDDGPIPEVTPWVLDILNEYNIKATFFCIGENVKKHPELFRRIIAEGHSVGNHTNQHLNGWVTNTETYISDVEAASEILKQNNSNRESTPSLLFRPPYGKLKPVQSKKIKQKGYSIVMWDVLSFDWDQSISPEKCLENVQLNLEPGSIVVFHDSLKAEKNLRYTLPETLEFIIENNWNGLAIS